MHDVIPETSIPSVAIAEAVLIDELGSASNIQAREISGGLMASAFQVDGSNKAALFTLRVHRGEGMALLAMNWKNGKPPANFVGFAIDYKEPGGDQFFQLKNRLAFTGVGGEVNPNSLSTRLSPIQKFRWVHFPRNAELKGKFTYRVIPVFMNDEDELSYGEAQRVAIKLHRETYPGKLNVTFTRGFVSSQAFVERYQSAGPISTLLPPRSAAGISFKATHPKASEALAWMGFEARSAIFEVLDKAIANKRARVLVVAYDLSEAQFVSRLVKLKKRLRIIIDDAGEHGESHSGESQAERLLIKSAGRDNVIRQHMGQLQHNKTIVVTSVATPVAICGSTNFSWRGFYVQANNAVILHGKAATAPFVEAFENAWTLSPSRFGTSPSAHWSDLKLRDINARVTFSPHGKANSQLDAIAEDIGKTTSSLLFSLAFLYQTPGAVREAVTKLTKSSTRFVYGISDRKVGGFDLLKPGGNVAPVFPAALAKNLPVPFKTEPTGGTGNRMHHKFVVIDFDTPDARVYFGSYNFSVTADVKNGENLVLIRDRRIATSYMVEAVRIFDHYHFRVAQQDAKKARKKLHLKKPPRTSGEKPWWNEDYTNPRKIRDRTLFAAGE